MGGYCAHFCRSHHRFKVRHAKRRDELISQRRDSECGLSMKTVIMILIIVLSTSASDVLITKGLKQEGGVSAQRLRGFLSLGRRVLTNKNFLVGLFFMIVSFFSFLAVLSWADLSLTIPATSLSYAFSTLGAKFVLKERISRPRWTGTLFVCIGIALISLP